MKINKILTAFFILIGSLGAFAHSFTDKIGYKGTVRLGNNSIERGEIYIDFDKEALMLQSKEQLLTYHLSQVSSFELYDHIYQRQRKFIKIEEDHKQFRFFEEILVGELSLLKTYQTGTENRIKTAYFILDMEGNLHKINNFKKQLSVFFKEGTALIAQYAKTNNYKLSNIEHQVELIKYYNRYKFRNVSMNIFTK